MEHFPYLITSIIISVYGIYFYFKLSKTKEKGKRVLGKIIAYEKEEKFDSENDYILYYPVIKFTDKGKVIEHKHSTGLSFQKYKTLPKRISIFYVFDQQKNKYEVLVENDKTSLFISYLLIGVGALTFSYILIFKILNLDISSLIQ